MKMVNFDAAQFALAVIVSLVVIVRAICHIIKVIFLVLSWRERNKGWLTNCFYFCLCTKLLHHEYQLYFYNVLSEPEVIHASPVLPVLHRSSLASSMHQVIGNYT